MNINEAVITSLGSFLSIDKYSTKQFGPVTVLRVDENTFTITEVDNESLESKLSESVDKMDNK